MWGRVGTRAVEHATQRLSLGFAIKFPDMVVWIHAHIFKPYMILWLTRSSKIVTFFSLYPYPLVYSWQNLQLFIHHCFYAFQSPFFQNKLTNHRQASGRKSLEHDGTLIRSEGYLSDFTVPIWKQYDEHWGGNDQKRINQSEASIHWSITVSNSILCHTYEVMYNKYEFDRPNIFGRKFPETMKEHRRKDGRTEGWKETH